MHNTIQLYCAASFASGTGEILSLGLVTPDNRWYYAETIDYRSEELDAHAVQDIVPRLMKIPRAHFVHGRDLEHNVAGFLKGLGAQSLDFRLLGEADPRITTLLIAAGANAGIRVSTTFSQVDLDADLMAEFLRHCGGPEKTNGHSLVQVIGAALCDKSRQSGTSFHKGSIHHFELLMGSKNAASYRAWARATERSWDDAHQPKKDEPAVA